MRRALPRLIALCGLAAMIAVIALPQPSILTAIIAGPLLILFVSGLMPPRRWGGWVAVAMVPYLCIAVGEAIADPSDRMRDAIVIACTIVVFFSSMDFVRQTGTSLRN